MTGSDWLTPHGSSADVENLSSHNEAELRRQFEERQQETQHVYELLENKIQLLQEVSGRSEGQGSSCTFPYCSAPCVPLPLPPLLPKLIKCPCVLGRLTLVRTLQPQFFPFAGIQASEE